MRLTTEISERLPQAFVLVGLLIVSTGIWLGFDYAIIFAYVGVGFLCFIYGVVLAVVMRLDGPQRSKTRPLSPNFISAGSTVIMPAPDARQEPAQGL